VPGKNAPPELRGLQPPFTPNAKLKLKVEINTREHESLYGFREYSFKVANPWFSGTTEIVSFVPEELFGTKLRALLQRRKSRDLFDLNEGMVRLGMDLDMLIACFEFYLAQEVKPISRAEAEQHMLEKLARSLTEDISPLLPVGIEFGDQQALAAFERIWNSLIARIKGDPWKLSGKVIEEFRSKGFSELLNAVR
jgi:predicted nucleotidyltransferase component of viral defense system